MGVLGMEEITISTSAVEIGRLAFPSCENLRHVDFGETGSLGAISLEAFPNADLEEVVLPQGVETIED
ncbi:MAG: leucine-rich repeat domain-containing protein, partial [Bacilli bacterium]|nr:leucine-rich repeat domain-containing protein [Bacilli bacterium]